VALVDVYTGNPSGSVEPTASWFNPFAIPFHDLVIALLLGIFIYWGWDSGVAVNRSPKTPTRALDALAVVSTLLLVGIYLVVSAGAQAYHGAGFLANEENAGDVLNALGKPRARGRRRQVPDRRRADVRGRVHADDDPPTARTTLSMARWGAIPPVIGKIHKRFLTPTVSTWVSACSRSPSRSH